MLKCFDDNFMPIQARLDNYPLEGIKSSAPHLFVFGSHIGVCYHRTQGLSAQDALVDVVAGLGVPVSRLVLNTPAIGLSFSLMDKTVNLPGSATTGPPSTVTYQQVRTD